MNYSDCKRITVVVSVLNGAQTLERCLESVISQTHEAKELIVIDGFSSDGSVDIIKKYSKDINYWISEPDTGIYSAWNKALRKATGNWISFLGCDDWWSSCTSLAELAEYACYPQFNFISGKMYVSTPQGYVLGSVGQPLDCQKLDYGMRIAHVGALHHRSLFETHGFFDESYRISGDYEFLLRASSSIKAFFVPKNLVYMTNSGLSNINKVLTIKEGCKALQKTKGFGLRSAIRLYTISYLADIKEKFLSYTPYVNK